MLSLFDGWKYKMACLASSDRKPKLRKPIAHAASNRKPSRVSRSSVWIVLIEQIDAARLRFVHPLRGFGLARVYNDSMGAQFRIVVFGVAAAALSAQTLSNKSLTGKYYFREVLLATDTSQTLSMFGTLTFNDANGSFAFAGTQITGSNSPANANGNGTYSVDSGGFVTMSDPLRSGSTINARLGTVALAGSNTEAGNNVFSILVAAPAPAAATSLSTLNGPYWVATLEFLNGDPTSRRETLFQVAANAGSLGSLVVLGEASNLQDTQITQQISGASYTVNVDGTGTVAFPPTNPANPSQQLLVGSKTIYVAGDGSFFFGGGTGAGGEGLLIGIRAGTTATNATLNGLYWSADLRLEGAGNSSFAGSASASGKGSMTWTRRLRADTGPLDVTAVTPYSVTGNGSGTILDNKSAVSADGQLFLGSGLSAADTVRYELFFGVRIPGVSGSGIFLNPQGVANVFSYAPPGNPIAPGEFITIFGTGLPLRGSQVPTFPMNLTGVQVLINNKAVPLYLITATQVFVVVPFAITGPTATIVLDNNGTRSNTITVPVAATSPGVASAAQNGYGAGAIQHADGSFVSASSPAQRGETVVVYLTGLGQVSPPVVDGAPAPGAPGLAMTNSVLAVYVNGVCGNFPNCDASNIAYQGLTPTYAGLYQINVTIPLNTPPGFAVPMAILTPNGFTDMVDIAVQ